MADLISRRPPRPYKLPESTQTSGKYTQQQYAKPEVLTAKKSKSQLPKAQIEKAQNIANRINSIRVERLRLLFPDADPGSSFEDYKQNELQNALDTLPPDQLNRYNWLIEKDQQLRSQLADIVGAASNGGGTTPSTPKQTQTFRRTKATAPITQRFSDDAQKIVDKYVQGDRLDLASMARAAIDDGYGSSSSANAKWDRIAKELGIQKEFTTAARYTQNPDPLGFAPPDTVKIRRIVPERQDTSRSRFSPEAQRIIDKYVKDGKVDIIAMAEGAIEAGYNSGDMDSRRKLHKEWADATQELGIFNEFYHAIRYISLQKRYGDGKGNINVEKMIADGHSQDYIEQYVGLSEQDYTDIKTVSAYKTDDGNVDVIKMINDLPQADVQRITGITDTEYHDLKQVGRYMDDQGNVDVAAMVESGATYSFLNRALNISQHDYDKIKTHFEAQEILEPYVDNGQLNLVGAVEAGHLGEIQQVYDINNEDLQQVFNYLELKSSGYIDDSGNVDVIKIISDGKVSEQTLTGALNLDTETLNTYKTVAQYLDADGNVDLVGVVEDGKLPEIQQVYNLSNDDLTRVFSYLELEKAGYVNDDGNVDVLSAIKDDKITDKVITGALNLDTETLNTYKTVAQYLDADGNVDLVGVVEDGKLPDVQKVLNLGNEELTKAFDYLEIKGAGYVDDEGNVDVIKAIADGKVSDRTLTNALDLDNDTMTNYKAVANYVDDEGNIDVLQAITDDVSYDILSIVGIDKTEYDNLKTISQYTDKEGQIDVVKALYHGVDPDILQSQLKLSEGEMQELKDYAKYEYWEPDKGISVNDLEAKLDTPGQPEWTKVIMAMKAAGVITSDGIPVDDEGYPIAGTALKKEWNKLTPEQKQAVADEWMGSWERVAVTGDKAMAGLEELTQKISSDKKAPKWVTEALKVVFPQLHMFDYTVNPEAKAKVDEVKTNVQNWVHSQINTHLRQHSIDDPSKGKRFAMGAATAVADIVSAIMIDIPIALHGIGEQVNEGEFRNAAAQSVALGGGMLLFPVTLPKKVLKEKSSGAGYVAGTVATLVLGPGSIIKLAKKGRAYIDPYGIPDRMAAIEFSTGRVPISKTAGTKLVQELVTTATKEIVSGKESGVIRKGGWELKYRTTPIQRAGASAVWHGTPDATPFAKLKPGETFVVDPKGALFTSAYATPRFVAATSMGKPAVKPGYVMIITDAGKIMTRTTGKKGLTGPFKTYKNKIETEVVANPTSTFTRAKNLRTRILGPKAGEFFTQYMGPDVPGLRSGSLVPVHVFIDRAVKGKGPLSPATLYAAKLTMIREALIDYATALRHPKRTVTDIIKRRQGPPGVREMEISKLARELETKAVENVLKKDLKGKTLEDALRVEIERQFRLSAERIYRELSAKNLESYYKTPDGRRRYEEIYNSYMEPVLRDAVRTYQTTDAISRTAVEYTETMPRATLEATSLEVERELPEEERYIMTVKRRQSLREHPRVNVDRAIADDTRVTDSRTTLDTRTLSIPVEPRLMTTAARADLRTTDKTAKVVSAPYKAPAQPTKLTVPPERIPPPKYPYSKDDKKPKEEKPREGKSDKRKRLEKPGTIHWRQGMWWISLIPRGRDKYVKVYTKAPPPGAPTKKRTPEETFFIKGGPDKVPKELLVDMGMQSVKISPTGEPNLRFKRRRRR